MDDVDVILTWAWRLAFGVLNEAGYDELEGLLPALIAVGYVESDERHWNFSERGVARINELETGLADR